MRYFLLFLIGLCLLVYAGGCSAKQKALKAYAIYIKQAPYDAIIVPGIQYDSAQPNSLLLARVYWAKLLYDKGITKNIIFSGAAVRTPYVESQVMKIIADSLGVPANHIFCEVKAQHSVENIYLGNRLAVKLGFKKVALATDPFQSSMLGSFIKKYTPDMARLPIIADSLYEKPMPAGDFNDARVNNFISIDKRLTFLQRMFKTFNIDTAALNARQ